MSDYRIIKPDCLPTVVRLAISCPVCGTSLEYEPQEDDAGAFVCVEDWPTCDDCGVLVDVPNVRLERSGSAYWAGKQFAPAHAAPEKEPAP